MVCREALRQQRRPRALGSPSNSREADRRPCWRGDLEAWPARRTPRRTGWERDDRRRVTCFHLIPVTLRRRRHKGLQAVFAQANVREIEPLGDVPHRSRPDQVVELLARVGFFHCRICACSFDFPCRSGSRHRRNSRPGDHKNQPSHRAFVYRSMKWLTNVRVVFSNQCSKMRGKGAHRQAGAVMRGDTSSTDFADRSGFSWPLRQASDGRQLSACGRQPSQVMGDVSETGSRFYYECKR
jgi:hypothetical protein